MRITAVDQLVNTGEFFVHHEDVRRADGEWSTRELDPTVTTALTRMLTRMARLLTRPSKVGVVLEPTVDGEPSTAPIIGNKAVPSVSVRGPISELVMFVYGRQAQADVELLGNDDDIETVCTPPSGSDSPTPALAFDESQLSNRSRWASSTAIASAGAGLFEQDRHRQSEEQRQQPGRFGCRDHASPRASSVPICASWAAKKSIRLRPLVNISLSAQRRVGERGGGEAVVDEHRASAHVVERQEREGDGAQHGDRAGIVAEVGQSFGDVGVHRSRTGSRGWSGADSPCHRSSAARARPTRRPGRRPRGS